MEKLLSFEAACRSVPKFCIYTMRERSVLLTITLWLKLWDWPPTERLSIVSPEDELDDSDAPMKMAWPSVIMSRETSSSQLCLAFSSHSPIIGNFLRLLGGDVLVEWHASSDTHLIGWKNGVQKAVGSQFKGAQFLILFIILDILCIDFDHVDHVDRAMNGVKGVGWRKERVWIKGHPEQLWESRIILKIMGLEAFIWTSLGSKL